MKVFFLRRFGVRLRDREVDGTEPLCGELHLYETQYQAGAVRTLALTKQGSTVDNTLAELAEPVIICLGESRMRFRGIEVVHTREGKAGMIQEWIVEVINR